MVVPRGGNIMQHKRIAVVVIVVLVAVVAVVALSAAGPGLMRAIVAMHGG
jgi:hypothetical protein